MRTGKRASLRGSSTATALGAMMRYANVGTDLADQEALEQPVEREGWKQSKPCYTETGKRVARWHERTGPRDNDAALVVGAGDTDAAIAAQRQLARRKAILADAAREWDAIVRSGDTAPPAALPRECLERCRAAALGAC